MSEADKRRSTVVHLKRLAHGLDSSIRLPGGFRIGLDAILGVVPFLGDVIGSLLSTYIVVQAARLGATTPMLVRMMLNVGVESTIGIVPAVGDLFDMAWKANNRNVLLLEQHMPDLTSAEPARRRLGIATVCLIIAFVMLLVILLFLSIKALLYLLGILTS
tara:strand:- start:129001 stop:129483 length:483 start_codon:yes stop_codon:yes gene_type:complete